MSLPQKNERSNFELFQSRLENIVASHHELVMLSHLIDWHKLEKIFGAFFIPKKGRPAIATRLMVGLLYLKHVNNLSDEQVVLVWRENPYWQYFCGEVYFQHEVPIHPTS